jgi:hypothetical protein
MSITRYLDGHWSLLVSLACPPPPPLLLFALNLPCSPEAAADALSGMLHSDLLLLLLREAWGEEGEIQTGGRAGNRALDGTSREEQQTRSTGYIIHGMLKVQYYDIVHIVISCVRVE